MRIKTVQLAWFRGAAESITLDTDLKNVIVYGSNGAGKSSFSDALEYLVRGGKINHLVHKEIGSKQKKGVINTHRPDNATTTATIAFDGDVKLWVEVSKDDKITFDSQPKEMILVAQTWQLERLLLRQDEVANFIIDTPGGKYSVLLPLLGLDVFEHAADNLNKLSRLVAEVSRYTTNQDRIADLRAKLSEYFTDTSDAALLKYLADTSKKYAIAVDVSKGIFECASSLRQSILARSESLTPEISRLTIFKRIEEEDLPNKLSTAKKKQDLILNRVDGLLDFKIDILRKSSFYTKNIPQDQLQITCPACGRPILKTEFEKHLNAELKALQTLSAARDEAIEARKDLKESITRVLAYAKDQHFTYWLGQKPQQSLKESFGILQDLILDKLNENLTSETQLSLSSAISKLTTAVKAGVASQPPDNKHLLEVLGALDTLNTVPELRRLENQVLSVTQILEGLQASITKVRQTIRDKTHEVISQISSDIQHLWSVLHPNEPIEDIQLYIPEEEDKSIDVGLKFFGVNQPSPRFTLSEGHRNSLGLCIFLALARLDKNKHLPIFLDDIVSSLDRQHRGNVTELLKTELGDRQILLFTHDREWFTELSTFLSAQNWKRLVLKPWTEPGTGMQWSTSEFTFDDARQFATTNCELGGNCVRQIMDAQTSIAAERLMVKMPYARGDRNDHRTCVEFLEYIISSAKKNLKKKNGTEFIALEEPIQLWQTARNQLIVRADRASHTGTLVKDELEKLITVCEASVKAFRCDNCGDAVWVANQTARQFLQCTCGNIRWKYD